MKIRIPFSSKSAEVFPDDGAHDEDGQLEDPEDEAVLGRGRPLFLGLVGVEGGLERHADGRAKVCDGEHKNSQLLATIELEEKHFWIVLQMFQVILIFFGSYSCKKELRNFSLRMQTFH